VREVIDASEIQMVIEGKELPERGTAILTQNFKQPIPP
jgi:hypothetical protein